MSKRTHDETPKSIRRPLKVRNFESNSFIDSEPGKSTISEVRTPLSTRNENRSKPETPITRLKKNEQSIVNLSGGKKNDQISDDEKKAKKIIKFVEAVEGINVEIDVVRTFNDRLREEFEGYQELIDRTKNVLDRTIRTKLSTLTIDVGTPCIEITSTKQAELLTTKFSQKTKINPLPEENLIIIEQKTNRLRLMADEFHGRLNHLMLKTEAATKELDERLKLREFSCIDH